MDKNGNSDFGIEILFLKLCKIYPEILKMEKTKPIASFLAVKLFDLNKDGKKSHKYGL